MSVRIAAFLDTAFRSSAAGPAQRVWDAVLASRPASDLHRPIQTPGRLGCYDLAEAEMQARLAAEAAQSGIDGFVIPCGRALPPLAWSAGFPLGFRWANQRPEEQPGDAADQALAIRQVVAGLTQAPPLLADGRLVLMVEAPDALPVPAAAAAQFRAAAAEAGRPGLYLLANRAEDGGRYTGMGYDALVDPDPAQWHSAVRIAPPSGYEVLDILAGLEDPAVFGDFRFDYRQTAASRIAGRDRRGKVLPRVFPPYHDWRDHPEGGATLLVGERAPATLTGFTEAAVVYAARHLPSAEQLVFVESWNDWGHGTQMEPSRQGGETLLRALRAGIDRGRYVERVWPEPPAPPRRPDQIQRDQALATLAASLRQGVVPSA